MMKEGLLYIYDGPPVVSGDPCCPRCGGTDFQWIGKCKICADKETDRWNELKQYLVNGLVEFGQFKECHTGKWEEAYQGLLSKMEELEKE
jgi:hypothetical protein